MNGVTSLIHYVFYEIFNFFYYGILIFMYFALSKYKKI